VSQRDPTAFARGRAQLSAAEQKLLDVLAMAIEGLESMRTGRLRQALICYVRKTQRPRRTFPTVSIELSGPM
jgi:hypothetical protein